MDFMAELTALFRSDLLLAKGLRALIIIAATYLVLAVMQRLLRALVDTPEVRQNWRSVIRITLIFIAVILVAAVWIEELRTVSLVLTGLMAAFLLVNKEVFLGLSGRILLFAGHHYKLSDRIMINGVAGDVVSIGLLTTRVMEVGGHAGELQSTGRVVTIPHIWLTQYHVSNQTTLHGYLWDEVVLLFPPDARLAPVLSALEETAKTALQSEMELARKAVSRSRDDIAYRPAPVTPVAYAELPGEPLPGNPVRVTLRFTVPVRRRREMHSALTQAVLTRLKQDGISLRGVGAVPQGTPYEADAEGAEPHDAAALPRRRDLI